MFGFESRWWLVGMLVAVASCATVGDDCKRQMSECVKRCERADSGHEPALRSLPPVTTQTECESRCGCRNQTAKPPPPQGPPTLTGSQQSQPQ